jgi:multidrug resistance efflux pump
MEHEKSALFGVYAIAAYIYGWWVTFHIASVVFDKLEPYGLEFISRSYVGLFLFVSVALPLWRLIQGYRRTRSGMKPLRIPRASAVSLVAVVLLLTVILFLPRRESIRAMCVVDFAAREQVTPTTPGWLGRWFVHEGSHVTEGESLAELENPMLENTVAEARLEEEAARVQWLSALNSPDEQTRQTAPALEKSLLENGEQLRNLQEQTSGLIVKAAKPGIIVKPKMEQEQGQYFPAGRLLAEIGDNSGFHVILPLTEQQARKVRQGDSVMVRLQAYPEQQLHGHVVTIPTAAAETFSTPLMASTLGGEFPSEPAKKQGEIPRPAIPCYEVVVALDAVQEPLRPGMMGHARIITGDSTVGVWIGQQILDWLNPTLRL